MTHIERSDRPGSRWSVADHESRVIAGLLRHAGLTVVCADRGADPAGLLRQGVLPLLRRRAVDQAVANRAPESLLRRAANVVIPFPDRRRTRDLTDHGEVLAPRTSAAGAEVVVIFDDWGPRPLSRLADAVATAVGVPMASARLGEAERWARTLQEAAQEHRPRVLLVLDRFEDLLDAAAARVDATLFLDVLATTLLQEPARLNMLLAITMTREGVPGDDTAWVERLAPLAARCGPLDEHCVRLKSDGRSFLLAEVERARAAAASRTMSAEAFRASIDAILMRVPPPGANDSRFIPSEFDAGDDLPAAPPPVAVLVSAAPPGPAVLDPAERLGNPATRWPRPQAVAPVTPPVVDPVALSDDAAPASLAAGLRPKPRSLPPLDLRIRPIFVVAPAALLLLLAVGIRLVLGDGDGGERRDREAPKPPAPAASAAPVRTPARALAPAVTKAPAEPLADAVEPAKARPTAPAITSDGSPRIARELAAALTATPGIDVGHLRIVGFDALRGIGGRVLLPLHSAELLFVVRADSPLITLRDMRGQRVDAGESGSTAALAAARVHERLFASGAPVAPAAAAPARTVDDWLAARMSDVLVVATDDAAAWLADLPAATRAGIRLLRVDKTNATERLALQAYLPATVADNSGRVPTLSTLRFLVDTGNMAGDTHAANIAGSANDAAVAHALCRALPGLQRDGHPKWRDLQPGLVVPTPAAWSSTARTAWRTCQPGR